VSMRPTVVVFGSFLGSEYFLRWQRQQEFTTCLMRRANVLFVERAAPGAISMARVAGRLRTVLAGRGRELQAKTPFPDAPAFVRWVQLPASGETAWRASAGAVIRAVERERVRRGWEPPSFACCGTPSEVWRHALEGLGVPFWYDLWERVLESATYASTDRDAMRYLAREASLMTADTVAGAADWRDVRADIAIVPHGAREWAAAPVFDRERDRLYYVGSVNAALDVTLVRDIAETCQRPVHMIGMGTTGSLGAAVHALGWRAAGDIPFELSDAAVGLVPYVTDAFGQGVYPTKVYDYLLAGAPVLATPLPSLEELPFVRTCTSASEFADAYEEARSLSVDERRAIRAYALEHGWSRRFETVRSLLEPVAPAIFGGEA